MNSPMERSDGGLSIAVLVDDEYVQKWERDALVSLAAEPDIRITHVVVNEKTRDHDRLLSLVTFVREAFKQIREYPLWSLVGVARLLTPDPEYERPTSIRSIEGVSDAEWLSCMPQSADGFGNTLPDETVDVIQEHSDVVIRFGFGVLKGRILQSPTYGVLSYHPGDIRAYRGQPGGFWEFLNGEDEMGVTLQRINETLDGGEIAAFEPIDISDANTWQEIKRRIFFVAEGMLVPGVRTLTDPEKEVTEPNRIGDLYKNPKGWSVIRYVLKNTRGRVVNVIRGGSLSSSLMQMRPVTSALLAVSGFTISIIHPMFTHHYVMPIHIEQIVSILIFILFMIVILYNGIQPRTKEI